MNAYTKICLAALSLTWPMIGCSQRYNGAWGVRPDQQQQARDYARTTAPPPGAPPEAAPETSPRATDVPRGGAGTIAFEDPATAAAMTRSATPPTYHTSAQASPISALGLYGDIATTDPRASPMDGSGNVRRVTFTSEGADFDVAVHPDRNLLVYASTRHRDTADLYLKSVTGTAVTQLTDDPANDVMPAISPDGTKVAFSSDRAGTWDIYMMDADGGQAVQITNDGFQNIHPSFSPDGKRLVYASYGSASGQWELVLITVDNPTLKQHIGHGLFPEWSPVGDTILFQRARQKGTRWFSIWTMDLKNGQPTHVTEVAASANAAVITPSWGPKGQHIVFCTVLDPGSDEQVRPDRADIWVVRADGTGRSRLTQGQYANLQPTWAADGSVFFVSDRARPGVENIWSIRPDQAMRLVATPTDPATARSAEVPTGP